MNEVLEGMYSRIEKYKYRRKMMKKQEKEYYLNKITPKDRIG